MYVYACASHMPHLQVPNACLQYCLVFLFFLCMFMLRSQRQPMEESIELHILDEDIETVPLWGPATGGVDEAKFAVEIWTDDQVLDINEAGKCQESHAERSGNEFGDSNEEAWNEKEVAFHLVQGPSSMSWLSRLWRGLPLGRGKGRKVRRQRQSVGYQTILLLAFQSE